MIPAGKEVVTEEGKDFLRGLLFQGKLEYYPIFTGGKG